MPSKYSHSVVLAQQSSHGLISLSNEQYIDYLRSSPLLTTKPLPQRASAAPPKNRERATSTKINGSDRLAVQNSLRQQTSSDQLATGPYRHQDSNQSLHGTARRMVVDSEEDDSGEYSDSESRSSQPSYDAYLIRSQKTNLRQKRLLHRLPIKVQQQVAQNGLLPLNPHDPQHVQMRKPQSAAFSEPDVRQSIELPIQMPIYNSFLPARSRVSAAPVHIRDVLHPKSLATPQLSPTSTEMTHQDDFPATPLASLQRETIPAIADDQKPNLSRDDSALSQSTRIFRPEPTKMPSQANFDGFLDDSDQGLGYFKDLPESAEARKVRLMNMRAYNAMEKAINDSPRSGTFGPDKNLPAVPNSYPDLHPPPQNRYRDRVDSMSSLSSMGDFAIGVPSVSQTTGQPKTSAAAMKPDPRSTIYELEAATLRNQTQSSASSKPTRLLPSTLLAQSLYQSSESSPTLLDPTTTSLSQFLNGLESRFSDPEPASEAAAPPPDIARHPPVMLDPLAQLIVDSRGGVTSLAAQGQEKQRQRSKGRILSSLRLNGKKTRGDLM